MARDERVVTQIVSIAQRTPPPTPRPTPPPTPVPTPKITPTPQPHYTLAPKIVVRSPAAKAAAKPTKHLGGAAAKKVIVRQTPQPIRLKATVAALSLGDGVGAGVAKGGAGTGAGAGIGTGGLGGTGSGSGTAGAGDGGDISTASCGDVFLEPGHLGYRPDGTVVQDVVAKFVTRDGTVAVAPFPWPFLYPGEKDNPFSHDDALGGHNGVPIQQPPPGTDIASLPVVVQIILRHSDARGFTTFKECSST